MVISQTSTSPRRIQPAQTQRQPGAHPISFLWDQRVPMRDGVHLSTDVFLPVGSCQFPAVLLRTPYESSDDRWTNWAALLASHGYAAVIQDCRGRYESDGEFYAYHQEGPDGVDTLRWIRSQAWANGRVGAWGRSYGGLFQWLMAKEGDDQLTCMAPHVIPADYYHEVAYIGGAFQLTHGLLSAILYITARTFVTSPAALRLFNGPRHLARLPLIDLDVMSIGKRISYWRDWLEHPTYDEYWKAIAWTQSYDRIDAPIFQHGGWFDPYAGSALASFSGMSAGGGSERARRHQRVMIGPSAHPEASSSVQGEVDFGPHAFVDIREEELRWFDHHLKGSAAGFDSEPPVSLFVMGRNEWRGEYEWPLSRATEIAYYLHSGGKANTLHGDGTLDRDAPSNEEPDRFLYDPADPVYTVGGNNSIDMLTVAWERPILAGPADQRVIEARQDVLVYTSRPLEAEFEVTGPIELILYAASSARDTDFTAKLIDVFPDGRSMNLAEGILRTRYRHGFTQLELLEANEPVELRIRLNPTCNVFMPGHRMRVDISSSNFPRFSRNLNTGEDVATGTRMQVAHQTVLHSTAYPSRILLPSVPTPA
jgi:putative CocE/NonD family hydrolase